MDSRWELEKRLKWINTTADRLAPLVKAQFRRALVQDAELKRRRAKLVLKKDEDEGDANVNMMCIGVLCAFFLSTHYVV
jgi:hypothetical protein